MILEQALSDAASGTTAQTDLDDRDIRALVEPMHVVPGHLHPRVPDHVFVVYSGERRYEVDLTAGTCTCPDALHRGLDCKHAWRCGYHTGEHPVPEWVDEDCLNRPLRRQLTYTGD
jgi:hypothetical protein